MRNVFTMGAERQEARLTWVRQKVRVSLVWKYWQEIDIDALEFEANPLSPLGRGEGDGTRLEWLTLTFRRAHCLHGARLRLDIDNRAFGQMFY
jgi:hypothetical protein